MIQFYGIVLFGYTGEWPTIQTNSKPLEVTKKRVEYGNTTFEEARGSTNSEGKDQESPQTFVRKQDDPQIASKRQSVMRDRQSKVATFYAHKALTLYNYNADPDDPSEISFKKGETLDILDLEGKWWQAKRVAPNGEVTIGIAPSNYLKIVA